MPTPTSSPTSSRGSSRECRRVVQLATGITSIARVGRVGEDPREEVGVGMSASWNAGFTTRARRRTAARGAISGVNAV